MVMTAPTLSKSDIAPKGVTSGQSNLLLEEQVQIGNALKVEIAKINNQTLGVDKQIAQTRLEIKQENYATEKNNLKIAKNQKSISDERLSQSKDLLSFEKENTKIQLQTLIVKHNKNAAALEGAKRELGDLASLLKLKHDQFQTNQISGFSG